MKLTAEFAGKSPEVYGAEDHIPYSKLAQLFDISTGSIWSAIYHVRGSRKEVHIEKIPTKRNGAGYIIGIRVGDIPVILEGLAHVKRKLRWYDPEESYLFPWAQKAMTDLRDSGTCSFERQHPRRSGKNITTISQE